MYIHTTQYAGKNDLPNDIYFIGSKSLQLQDNLILGVWCRCDFDKLKESMMHAQCDSNESNYSDLITLHGKFKYNRINPL